MWNLMALFKTGELEGGEVPPFPTSYPSSDPTAKCLKRRNQIHSRFDPRLVGFGIAGSLDQALDAREMNGRDWENNE